MGIFRGCLFTRFHFFDKHGRKRFAVPGGYTIVMCFSATASFIAGGALSTAGAVLLSRVKNKKELPLAAIPLLFGVQQIIEGVVWLSLGSALPNTLNLVGTYAYVMFSHVLWPVLLPVAVLLIETDPVRKKILTIFSVVGLTLGLYLLYFVATASMTSQILNHSICYSSVRLPLPFAEVLYLVVVCGSCLVSSRKVICLLGGALFISYLAAHWFFSATLFSTWCFFAALLSVIVFIYFRKRKE